MTTIRQRAVYRRRPRAMPLGTVREWLGGTFVKVAPGQWSRRLAPMRGAKAILSSLPKAAAKDRGGLAGLTRAMGAAVSSQATLVAHLARHVARTLIGRDSLVLALPSALSAIMSSTGSSWDLYCARRWAEFNDGLVDMTALPGYVKQAWEFYEWTLPDTFVKKGDYTGPRTVADVNLASWMQFFAEGGGLNQPAWLETNRLKDLRHQFELLANMHGGH